MPNRLRLSGLARRRAVMARGQLSRAYSRHSFDPNHVWPDEYPLRIPGRRADEESRVMMRDAVTRYPISDRYWVSIILRIGNRAPLFRLDETLSSTPDVWSPPCSIVLLKNSSAQNAIATLFGDTGVLLPEERFEQIASFPTYNPRDRVRHHHEFFGARWTPEDGPEPETFPLSPGAAECRLFSKDNLPRTFQVPYSRDVIVEFLRRP